jgi:hypothetical protein
MRPKAAAAFLAAWSIASFWSCGGEEARTPTGPVVTRTPAGSARTVVAQGGFSVYAPGNDLTSFLYSQFTTNQTGDLEATIDWTDASDELWMYIAEGACTADQFETDACPGPECPCKFSASSEEAIPKPRVLKIASAGPGTRTLIIWSLRPKPDAVSYQVVLTSPAAKTSTAPAPTGNAVGGGLKAP